MKLCPMLSADKGQLELQRAWGPQTVQPVKVITAQPCPSFPAFPILIIYDLAEFMGCQGWKD